MMKTSQWRFTPPTHVVAALRAALDQFVAEGGQPARGARYAATALRSIDGMAALGFRPFLDRAMQAPVIVTFHAPRRSRLRFQGLLRGRARSGLSCSIRAS